MADLRREDVSLRAILQERDRTGTARSRSRAETVPIGLYVQAKGGLRRELGSWLRTDRVERRLHPRSDERRQPMLALTDQRTTGRGRRPNRPVRPRTHVLPVTLVVRYSA